MNHATDSANTAATLATGHKSANGMLSLTLYEQRVSTLVEDAMYCGKAGKCQWRPTASSDRINATIS
jgi:alkaline phosphatase